LVNQLKKMLEIVSPLDVTAVRNGLRRRYRFIRLQLLPSQSVILEIARRHPDFVINSGGLIRHNGRLDYRMILGEVEAVFVDVFRQSPSGPLDRSSFETACNE